MKRLAVSSVFLAILTGCGGGSSGAAPVDPPVKIVIPDVPILPNDALTIDFEDLEARAAATCSENPKEPPARHFVGGLPRPAVTELCDAPAACANCSDLFGRIYVAGYFSGLALRDALRAPVECFEGPDAEKAEPTDPGERETLERLIAAVEEALALAREDDDATAIQRTRAALPSLLDTFGAQRGYFDQAIGTPPPEVPSVNFPILCEGFLGCQDDHRPQDLLDRYAPALDKLVAPPNRDWAEAAAIVALRGPLARQAGRAAWAATLLGLRSCDGSSYGDYVTGATELLLTANAAALAAMTGSGDASAADARCAALVHAAREVLDGGYAIGLASDAPEGTFPEIECD